MRVDVRGLLIGQHARRIRRHLLTRRPQLHDERLPHRWIDQLRTGAATLPRIAMAFETADCLKELLAVCRIAVGGPLRKGAARNKEAGENAGPEDVTLFD